MGVKRYFNYNFLIALRRKKGETQESLATALGLSTTTIAYWEQGIKSPHQDNLRKLANYFNVDWTLFVSKAEQLAWQNYQFGIMMAHGSHDDHRADATNLNALPAYQTPDEPPSEAQQEDDDLLSEGEQPELS